MSPLDHFRLLRADARTEIHNLTLDSRTAGEGSLFLALHGAREDGADYAKKAAARGAVCVVEWSEKVQDALFGDEVVVRIDKLSDTERRITIDNWQEG